MTGFSRTIAEIIGRKLDYDEEGRKVLAYGAFGIMQFCLSIVLVVMTGIIFKVLPEALVISFTAAILRKFSGGAHATSPGRCLAIGTVFTTVLAVAVDRLLITAGHVWLVIYMVACVVFSIAAIWTYAPVDNPNKPITKEERRMKFKKESIASVFIISLVSVALFSLHLIIGRINWLLPVSLAIFTGMAWQSFTLLKSGRWLISRMDGCFCALIKPKGGEVE